MRIIIFSLSIFTLISCKKDMRNIKKNGASRDNELTNNQGNLPTVDNDAHGTKI